MHGDVQRGTLSLGAGLAFPILLGWIDAARLALLDETRLQARLNVQPSCSK